MTNLRLIVPVALVAQVLALLRELRSVTNVVHVPGAGVEPAGDLITADRALSVSGRVLSVSKTPLPRPRSPCDAAVRL